MPTADRAPIQQVSIPKAKRAVITTTHAKKKPPSLQPVSMRADVAVAKPLRAKLFQNGRSQAVRLPKEFRFEGKEVQVSRQGKSILLTPVDTRTREQRWNDFLAMLAEYRDLDPMPGGREQGITEPEEIFPEDW